MRNPSSDLSFENYLKQYVVSLSVNNTQSLKKLLSEASHTNPRLKEPLILYIHFNQLEKTYLKFQYQCSKDFKSLYLKTKSNYADRNSLLLDLENKKCPEEFNKIYVSYLYQKNKKQNEDELKKSMIMKIIQLTHEKKLTRYRISKELNINPGNLNSFLNHRKTNALSMKKSIQLLNYMNISQ